MGQLAVSTLAGADKVDIIYADPTAYLYRW